MLWLSEHEPFEADRSKLQIEGIMSLLGPSSRRVLDIGCGTGRVMIPLASAGHTCSGLDHDQQALSTCDEAAAQAGVELHTHTGNFHDAQVLADLGGPFDAVLCLGNTFMTISEIDQAAALVGRIGAMLAPGGWFVIDDVAGDFWPEVAEGYWQNGIAESGDMQMLWAEDDALFAIRMDDAVDESNQMLQDDDRRFRLWTRGSLELLALATGLSAPKMQRDCGLITFGKP